jgi:Putative restriction endonuclease
MTLAAALRSLPGTPDEFEAWCARFDGSEIGRFEFLYGCVVAEPPARWPHGKLDATLCHRLASHVEDAGLGLVFGSSQGFALAITLLVRDDRGCLGSESTATGDQAASSVLLPGFAVRPADIFP